MRLIGSVTVGKDIPFAIIDDEDYDFISSFKWYAQPTTTGGHYYRMCVKNIYMHKLIMQAGTKVECDHINRITHDNRKNNLRICGRSGNCQNKSSVIGSTSKFLGVSWNARDRKWMAALENNNKTVLSGHRTEEQAALAYNDTAIKYHGDFANLNVVPNEKYYRMLTLLESI